MSTVKCMPHPVDVAFGDADATYIDAGMSVRAVADAALRDGSQLRGLVRPPVCTDTGINNICA